MPRARDTQRSKVYSLSPASPEARRMLTLAECEKLIKDAHTRYGRIWRGRVHHGGGTRRASGSPSRINLPMYARTPETVLHEAAHAIHMGKETISDRCAFHGPEFTRVMLELWAWARLDTLPALRKQAREKRVKVSQDAKWVPPKARAVSELEKTKARYLKAKAEYDIAKAEYDAAFRALRAG